jgi:hypothetical protein
MTKLARNALLASALAVTALAVAIGTAAATRTINVPSQVSIKSEGLQFSGRVTTAPNGKPCRGQRRVVLFRAFAKAPDQPLARDTTGEDGEWKITLQGSAGISFGRFYAKVKKRSDGAAGTIHVCLPDKSKVIGVSHP